MRYYKWANGPWKILRQSLQELRVDTRPQSWRNWWSEQELEKGTEFLQLSILQYARIPLSMLWVPGYLLVWCKCLPTGESASSLLGNKGFYLPTFWNPTAIMVKTHRSDIVVFISNTIFFPDWPQVKSKGNNRLDNFAKPYHETVVLN